MRLCLLVVPLAACAWNTTSPESLSELTGTARVKVSTANDPTGIYGPASFPFVFKVTIELNGCLQVNDDVTVTLDGDTVPMLTHGGEYENVHSDRCDAVAFQIVAPRTTASSQIEISDPTATWTVAASRLYVNDFVLQPQPGSAETLVWQDATKIEHADALLKDSSGAVLWASFSYDDKVPTANVTTTGNTIHISAPAPISGPCTLAVTATRTEAADTCTGPQSCEVEARAGAELPLL